MWAALVTGSATGTCAYPMIRAASSMMSTSVLMSPRKDGGVILKLPPRLTTLQSSFVRMLLNRAGVNDAPTRLLKYDAAIVIVFAGFLAFAPEMSARFVIV